MATPEGMLKKEVVDYLDAAGIFHHRMNTGVIRKGSRFIHLCREGTADVLVCLPHRPNKWVELKGVGQKTTRKRQEAQAEFRDEVLQMGQEYRICESLDEVIEFLK